ncbi:MAG: hypothetical protein K6G62_04190 [Eubacterium sp.]|nr:hypothetical protein [Eubacterium sp.]
MKAKRKNLIIRAMVCAIFGALIGFIVTESIGIAGSPGQRTAAVWLGYSRLATYYEKEEIYQDKMKTLNDAYEKYCKDQGLNPKDSNNMTQWMNTETDLAAKLYANYANAQTDSQNALNQSLKEEFTFATEELEATCDRVSQISSAAWAGLIGLFVGFFMALCSLSRKMGFVKKILAALGIALLSAGLGALSGLFAETVYKALVPEDLGSLATLLARGLGWSVMGLGVGFSVGLIRPRLKKILLCSLGGFLGAFLGGCLFEIFAQLITTNGVMARGLALLSMGALIGIGVGFFLGQQLEEAG